ncbi:MAG: PhnD/SsuA/transferrin family substrate-binding protein [Alphaproteobacteria bacterium]|nr:PhnD/SsuA/transferrin family substrate-binding protein [Alphaproteobacteria bacterium]
MIAALPMYDGPETRAATDRFWQLINEGLARHGIDGPDSLTRDRTLWEIWQAPDLVLAQTCGLPYRARLHGSVTLIGAADFGLPGCAPGEYNSVILGRAGPLPDAPVLAVNEALSQSGWAALDGFCRDRGLTPSDIVLTGAHRASVRAVLDGRADLAACDAQSWWLMQRHDDWSGSAAEIARTPPTPGLPFITRAGQDPAPYLDALRDACAALAPEDRAALNLRGIVAMTPGCYTALSIPRAPGKPRA